MLRNWCVRAEAQPGVWFAWSGPALLVLDDNGVATADKVAGSYQKVALSGALKWMIAGSVTAFFLVSRAKRSRLAAT
jgi:hypothetical protein